MSEPTETTEVSPSKKPRHNDGDNRNTAEEQQQQQQQQQQQGPHSSEEEQSATDEEIGSDEDNDNSSSSSIAEEELSSLLWPTRSGVKHEDPQMQMQALLEDMHAMKQENINLQRLNKRKLS